MALTVWQAILIAATSGVIVAFVSEILRYKFKAKSSRDEQKQCLYSKLIGLKSSLSALYFYSELSDNLAMYYYRLYTLLNNVEFRKEYFYHKTKSEEIRITVTDNKRELFEILIRIRIFFPKKLRNQIDLLIEYFEDWEVPNVMDDWRKADASIKDVGSADKFWYKETKKLLDWSRDSIKDPINGLSVLLAKEIGIKKSDSIKTPNASTIPK